MRPLLRSLLSVCLFTLPIYAAVPYQVADLRTKPNSSVSSSPFYWATVNNAAIFVNRPPSGRPSLWRTDGTEQGTSRLFDLVTPTDFPFPLRGLASVPGAAYFGATDASGWKIWRSDGTPSGTVAITAASPTSVQPFAVLGSRVVFLDGAKDVWVAEGTQTKFLTKIHTAKEKFFSFATLGSNVYIGTESGMWKSDGSPGGTSSLLSLQVTGRLVLANGRIFFAAVAPDTGGELWVSDGTQPGTHIVADLNPGLESTFFNNTEIMSLGDRVIFTGTNGELGVSDGTAQATRVIRTGSPLASTPSAVLNGVAFFAFNDGQHGRELWRSDGTTEGTRLVRDASDFDSAALYALVAGATKIYYYGSDRTHPNDLFESDGTEAGTHVVADRPNRKWRASGETLVTIGDALFFPGDDGETGNEPWVTDGSAAGAHLIANLGAESQGSSAPTNLIDGGARLYFNATSDDEPGAWVTDGSSGGTRMLVRGESADTTPIPLAVMGNLLYLKQGLKLLKSDMVMGGQILVKDFGTGGTGPTLENPVVTNGRLLLTVYGRDLTLWSTDGTEAGTVQLTRPYDAAPTRPVSLAGQLYFVNNTKGTLYATDGTLAGTRLMAQPQDVFSVYTPLCALGGALYFFSAGPDNETRLWRFSGAAGDATIVARFPGTSTIATPTHVAVAGSSLFFTLRLLASGEQLWRSDGTQGGTVMIKEFPAFPAVLTDLFALGSRIVFGSHDGRGGSEAWVSDGTSDGTRKLGDIRPTGYGFPAAFVVADGIAYFAGDDPQRGPELWQTDGTPEGTQIVADLVPGAGGSAPAGLTRSGDFLYFAATSIPSGRELWAYPLKTPSIAIDDARASERDRRIAMPVRLSRAAKQRIVVDYQTDDDTAKAGRDYTSTSGSLTFEAGETVKTIDVPIADDATPGVVRSFWVRLSNATAPIARGAAAGLIEDDDVVVDVAVSLLPTETTPLLNVTNAGPSTASNVTLCLPGEYADNPYGCSTPFTLTAGASRQFPATVSVGGILAKVTSWERDSNPANNKLTSLALTSWNPGLYVSPATPRAGESATLTVGVSKRATPTTITLASSDPSVAAVPATVTVPANAISASTPFTALKSGTIALTATVNGFTSAPLPVRIVSAAEPARSAASVTLFTDDALTFGAPNAFTVRVLGANVDGSLPTGTVTFSEDGNAIAAAVLLDRRATLVVPNLIPGSRRYSASYGGDANFFDALAVPQNMVVSKGTPSFFVTAIRGTSDVLITLRGLKGYPPTGTVVVTENGQSSRNVSGPLQKADDGSATVTALGFTSAARTVTVSYSGDERYGTMSATVPISRLRRETIRH
jgi:ELWxxDGT repeat protein